jgi:hypothetical protein
MLSCRTIVGAGVLICVPVATVLLWWWPVIGVDGSIRDLPPKLQIAWHRSDHIDPTTPQHHNRQTQFALKQ